MTNWLCFSLLKKKGDKYDKHTHPHHRPFHLEPKALPEANGHYQAHLTVDSGNGVGRTLRFFTFTPLFQSADRAIAYAKQQAHEWMKQKALA